MPAGALTVLPEPQLRLIKRNEAEYDFGLLNVLDTNKTEHVFTVKNNGENPVTITQMESSCRCTTVDTEEIAGRKPSSGEDRVFVLEPQQDMKLRMTVRLVHPVAGRISQTIFIHTDASTAPAAFLRLTGIWETGLAVSPTTLDFGRIKAGDKQSREITVVFDPRLASGTELPPLESQCDPRWGGQTKALVTVTEKPRAEPDPETKPAAGMRKKSYLVTIQPEKTGDLAAHLFFAPLAPDGYKGELAHEVAAEAFRSLSVAILAKVE